MNLEEHRRRLVYDSPASRARRDDLERASKPADQTALLRTAHRDEVNEMGERHRRAGIALGHKHQRERASDKMISNGNAPPPGWVLRETGERRALGERHADERATMQATHRAAMEKHLSAGVRPSWGR